MQTPRLSPRYRKRDRSETIDFIICFRNHIHSRSNQKTNQRNTEKCVRFSQINVAFVKCDQIKGHAAEKSGLRNNCGRGKDVNGQKRLTTANTGSAQQRQENEWISDRSEMNTQSGMHALQSQARIMC
jgi:hypothetical protein